MVVNSTAGSSSSKYNKAKKPSGGLFTQRRLQFLVALPLSVALFALSLQLFRGSSGGNPAHIHLTANVNRDKELLVGLPQVHKVAELTSGAAADTASQPAARGQQAAAWWQTAGPDPNGPKVAFCVTTADNLRQIRQWLAYHRLIGVGAFYLFVDGPTNQPDNIAQLQAMPGVKVIPHDAKLKARHAKSRIWNESWLSAFFHKPCNHELFVLQSLNMEIAISMALKDGMDWILHIDTDELVLPAASPGGSFSLQQLLMAQPEDVDNVVFPNYESMPEAIDVKEPFLEVVWKCVCVGGA